MFCLSLIACQRKLVSFGWRITTCCTRSTFGRCLLHWICDLDFAAIYIIGPKNKAKHCKRAAANHKKSMGGRSNHSKSTHYIRYNSVVNSQIRCSWLKTTSIIHNVNTCDIILSCMRTDRLWSWTKQRSWFSVSFSLSLGIWSMWCSNPQTSRLLNRCDTHWCVMWANLSQDKSNENAPNVIDIMCVTWCPMSQTCIVAKQDSDLDQTKVCIV